MRLQILAGLISTALCGISPAFAQALPDTVRAVGVTVAQWQAVQDEVRRAAAARGASEAALAAVASRVSAHLVQNGRIDLAQLLHSIDDRAQRVAELQSQLAAMEGADDPVVAQLLSQARGSIEAGELKRGDQLLARAAESDLAGIARDQARLATRQSRAAATISERGRLAFVSADYLGAAALYAQAADTVPETDTRASWQYRMGQASSLVLRGDLFSEPARSREAVRLYRDVALPLAPRATHASAWALTQNDLGIALEVLGERGDEQALRDAIAAYRVALEAFTAGGDTSHRAMILTNLGDALRKLGERGDEQALRDAVAVLLDVLQTITRRSDPAIWAGLQNNLGNVLIRLGELGDDQALREAVVAYRSALEVDTRESAPADWARDQSNLGAALRVLGQRGDQQALRDAVVASRAALEVTTRSRAPTAWARYQNNLGVALLALGLLGDEQALREAVVAFRFALEVDTRESAPAMWARDQSNLGAALGALGQRGDNQALRDAVVAFRAALEIDTREGAPANWARDQGNLAVALHIQAQRGDQARLPEALAAAQAALGGFEQAGNSFSAQQMRELIAQLQGR